MYPKFIEVHSGDQTMIVNIDRIGIVKDKLIMIDNPTRWQPVDESYDEIKQLIKDSGIHIHKADPRLDTSHPLTMDDLKDMVGQPVWNSNTGEWWLIHWYDEYPYDEYPTYDKIIVYNNCGVQECWDRDDLSQRPLYRMKQ